MVKTVNAITRAIQVLDVLRIHPSLSLAKLHHLTAIDKATLLRILKTLQESGWIYRSVGDATYRLSYSLKQSPSEPTKIEIIGELSSGIIQELQKKLYWPSDIAVRSGLAMQIVESTRSNAPFILNHQEIGFRPAMLFSAMGRTYLAYCPQKERDSIIAGLKQIKNKEGRLAHDENWLQQLLLEVRERGYSEREPSYWGVMSNESRRIEAIAVPIFSESKIIAVLTLSWPQGSVDPSTIPTEILPHLQRASAQLSERLIGVSN